MQKHIIHKQSRYEIITLTIIFSAVLLFLCFIPLKWYWLILNGTLIVLGYSYLNFYKSAAHSIQKIHSNFWEIEYVSGKIIQGVLQGSSISTSLLSILVVKSPEHWLTKKVVIFKDALSKQQYHQLRLQLKGFLD